MKLRLSIALTLTALSAGAGELSEFAAGRDYYVSADFSKAAARFQVLCNVNNDAEACYWTGLSYERMADIRTPFGCKIDAKAHYFLARAMRLTPGRPRYRDALFDFLLNTADCSRAALREAAGILSTVPEADPEHYEMSRRLEEERRLNSSADARLARLFLIVPRATYSMATLPGAVVADRHAGGRCRRVSRGARDTNEASRARPASSTDQLSQ